MSAVMRKEQAERREEEKDNNKRDERANLSPESNCICTLWRVGMYWVVHPRGPRGFPEGNLESQEKPGGGR